MSLPSSAIGVSQITCFRAHRVFGKKPRKKAGNQSGKKAGKSLVRISIPAGINDFVRLNIGAEEPS